MENNEKAHIRSLQAEIKAMQDVDKEARSLIKKIDEDTKKISTDTEGDLVKLREQIRKDLAELKTFITPDIPETECLRLCDHDNKYGLSGDNEYPCLRPEIMMGKARVYDLRSHSHSKEIGDIAITEDINYSTMFLDGTFADEYKTYDVNPKCMAAFYRNWPGILTMAYEELLSIYKDKAEKSLKEALDRKVKALKRQLDIKASLMAMLEE